MTPEIKGLMNATQGYVRTCLSLFADFANQNCPHNVPCRTCTECWQKICEELRKDDHEEGGLKPVHATEKG